MFIIFIGYRNSNSISVQLTHDNVVIDPRYIVGDYLCEFRFSVNGRILTITRTDRDGGWNNDLKLRAYLPTEDIPDFTSTVYTHHGLVGEEAPRDTTEVIFAPSVNIIQRFAFYRCRSLVRFTIPDTVTRIGESAFSGCDSLRFIRFSHDLIFIGEYAFYGCKSLQAVFLPHTVTHIGNQAFAYCKSLRFFYVPEAIAHLGYYIIRECERILTIANNDAEVNQWLMQRHADFHLHKACSSTSVTFQGIAGCIQEHGIECATEVDDQPMTALHILCANPHVTGDAIRVYLQLAPEAANIQDGTGMTGLHILCSLPYQDTFTGDAIRSYLNLAPEAVNVQDLKRKTPFHHLCNSDDTFLDDRNFSTLMAWWYHCMPPQNGKVMARSLTTGIKRGQKRKCG